MKSSKTNAEKVKATAPSDATAKGADQKDETTAKNAKKIPVEKSSLDKNK